MDKPIAETNIGFRLVAKMGWQAGTGLGRQAQGGDRITLSAL